MAIKKCENCSQHYGKRFKNCRYCGIKNNDVEVFDRGCIGLIVIGVFFLAIIYAIYYRVTYESDYEKEVRYSEELSYNFNANIDIEIANVLLSKNKSKRIFKQKITTQHKICPIKFDWLKNKGNGIYIDHPFSKHLIRGGYNLHFDIKELDYLIFTDTEEEDVGDYVDIEGNKTFDAYIAYNTMYIYDLKLKQLFFIVKHKGNDPKENITTGGRRFESPIGENWNSEDYLNYLIENKFLPNNAVSNKKKHFYSKEYVEYLEKNNFIAY